MLKRLFRSAVVVASTSMATPAFGWSAEMESVTANWDAFLKKYVNAKGGVDYVAIKKDGEASLQAVLDGYNKIDPKGANDNERKALYINFYNAGMIYNILAWAKADKVDVASNAFLEQQVNKISAPGGNIWNGEWRFKMNGTAYALDDIEHGLIRGESKKVAAELKVSKLDPRIHSAVNCAAFSCPRVREKAYRADTIDAMLEENMHEWLGSEEQFSKSSESKLKANQIVFWYYDDFDSYTRKSMGTKGAGDYLAKFVLPTAKDADWKKKHLMENFNDRSKVSLRLSSSFDFNYDWKIADTRRKK
jgi:hypothetical protein